MGTDSGHEFAELREQLRSELQAEVRGEIRELRAELDQLRNAEPPTASPQPQTDIAKRSDRVMSRRGALMLGTAAAVGAGMAVEAASLAQPAAAAQGDSLVLGEITNDAGANDTSMTSTGPDFTLELTNSGPGEALVAGDGATGSGAGVVATLLNSENTSSALSGVTGGTGAGVSALSAGGYGVDSTGLLAPLHLANGSTAGAPTTGDHQQGEVFVDMNGTFFKSLTAGTPGTWAPMYSTVPLSTPIRLLDTRPGHTAVDEPGHPVTGGDTLALQVTGAAVGGVEVPAGAVAVVGNVTAVDAVAHGYLTLYPDGVTTPGTSSINFPATTSVANGVTVALSVAGKLEIFASQTTDVIFDATGYII